MIQNCIVCDKEVNTVAKRDGLSLVPFTPHFKRNGMVKCKDCGPFKARELVAPQWCKIMHVQKDKIAYDIDGTPWIFMGDKQWHFIANGRISDFGVKELRHSDNLGPYTTV